ncbi:hypothetical protein FHT44_005144 [Mycolicibacterium sp. BK634]|uniref:hypothetical protein n=1 Tax=Mycolicibacterium sp. BK634 TaxID=2587099 RepID=UPI001609F239|nr:hypothetical protein [Mycolicibacterium sp. BK634]MBB3752632.1 hypothetical protein [Mycolicibacterium sp. BK634]
MATTVTSLFAMAEATIRGIDYLKVPDEGVIGTLATITDMGVAPDTLGLTFLLLGMFGTLAVVLHRWVPAALIHAFLGGIFLVMGAVALSPAVAVGYGFRGPLSYILIFAVVHLCAAGSFLDRWWARRGRREVRLDL